MERHPVSLYAIHSFIHSFDQFLLGACYESGAVLGTNVVFKANMFSLLLELMAGG